MVSGADTGETSSGGARTSGAPPATRVVDVAVVGAGTAGLAAFRAAAAVSRNVVLIEGGVAGTTCAWAHQQRMTVPQMLSMPFYHPVVEEGIRTALRDVASRLATVEPSEERKNEASC